MGNGPWALGMLVVTRSLSKKCQSSRGGLYSPAFGAAPYDYFLALLDVLLKRTPPNCKCKHCTGRNWPFNLPSDVASVPFCVVSYCWPLAIVFLVHLVASFLSAEGQPKARCSGSRWPTLGASLQALLPLLRHYRIVVFFFQEYTNRNRARHHSRCGWPWIMVLLWKTAAVDAVVCCKQLMLVPWSHYRNMVVPVLVWRLRMHLSR